MSISKIGQAVGESVTLKLNQTAAMLKAKGEPIIHLGGGEPKSKAPIEAIESAVALVKTGEVRYGPAGGTPDMKKAVVKYTTDNYNYDVKPENVIASGGASNLLWLLSRQYLTPAMRLFFPYLIGLVIPIWLNCVVLFLLL